METVNARAGLKSNTGYRFISKSKDTYKISIPKPHGGHYYRSVGYKKLGEEKGLRKSIIERNKIGKKLWGKHWHRVVSNCLLLSRLPRSLEPTLYLAPDRSIPSYEYRARWISYIGNKKTEVTRRYSCNKHGKLGAYSLAKQELQEAHKEHIELLVFMGRASIVKLK